MSLPIALPKTTAPATITYITPIWIGPQQALQIAAKALRPLAQGRSETSAADNGILSVSTNDFTLRLTLPGPGQEARADRTITAWVDGGIGRYGGEERALAMVVRAFAAITQAKQVFWPLGQATLAAEDFVNAATPVVARRVTRRTRAPRHARPAPRRILPTRVTPLRRAGPRPLASDVQMRKQVALLHAQSLEAAVRGHILTATETAPKTGATSGAKLGAKSVSDGPARASALHAPAIGLAAALVGLLTTAKSAGALALQAGIGG